MELNNASIEQLKRWLSVWKLSTTGTKKELILRLNKVPKEVRGKVGEMAKQKNDEDGDKSKGNDSSDEIFEDGGGIFQKEGGDGSNGKDGDKSNGKDGGIQSYDEEDGDKSDGGIENYIEEDGETNGKDGAANDEVAGSILRIRGKRSNEKGGEQNEDGGRNDNYAEDGMHNQAGENSRNAKSSERKAVVENFSESIDVSLGMATQVLSEFSGESCARKWTTQVQNIATIYGIRGKFVKMLMLSKIKGKAYEWLHADSDRVLLPLDDLMAELISMFGEKSSKLEIRRKFEGRKWKQSETFGSYVDDKIMLAQGLNIDADEMLSCIIEGIPNQGLRNQAHIQCFVDVGHIKRAFADVSLPKLYGVGRPTTSTDPKDSKETRCFNCNAKGHWAYECRKSKREKGSCYACGEMGHFVAKCLKNKNKNEGENKYNAS
ncbi:uncharacterized protein [Drosophila suzukii]|uniref:CCHC-type domain-containing protein n=1 Tax=Drosophila suzukii TaxID=28584 RepID=A0ABM4TW52_DROSZ